MLNNGFYQQVFFRAPDYLGQVRCWQAPFDVVEINGVQAMQPRSHDFGAWNGTETTDTDDYYGSGGGCGLFAMKPGAIVADGPHVFGDASDSFYGLHSFGMV